MLKGNNSQSGKKNSKPLVEKCARALRAKIQSVQRITNMIDRKDTRADIRHEWIARRKAISPQAITLSRGELIKSSFLDNERMLPLVIEPNVESVRLCKWVSVNMEFLESKLLEHGSILFRGFDVRD